MTLRRLAASCVLGGLLACSAGTVFAQLRTIPEDAVRGTMRHVQNTIIEIDGQRALLSAGAQIRGVSNTIVLPTALPPDSLVKYQRDQAGQVHRVWILTPQEAAQPDKP
jgi:hypothetical protein